MQGAVILNDDVFIRVFMWLVLSGFVMGLSMEFAMRVARFILDRWLSPELWGGEEPESDDGYLAE